LVVAGRKIRGVEGSTLAIGTATITGTGETLCVFSLALGVEQIEQECRPVFALSGCEWTACTVPMAKTSTTQSAAATLLDRPCSPTVPCMVLIV
jgi:hypothetical protein